MAFVREVMTEADHAKVFTPESIMLVSKNCYPQTQWDPSKSNTFAIDRERNVVFLMVEKFAPPDIENNYLLIVDGKPVALQMGGATGRVIFPFKLPPQLEHRKEEVKQLIADAFVVYGMYGIGDPTSLTRKVSPIFQE